MTFYQYDIFDVKIQKLYKESLNYKFISQHKLPLETESIMEKDKINLQSVILDRLCNDIIHHFKTNKNNLTPKKLHERSIYGFFNIYELSLFIFTEDDLKKFLKHIITTLLDREDITIDFNSETNQHI